jgi:hypothetical protein
MKSDERTVRTKTGAHQRHDIIFVWMLLRCSLTNHEHDGSGHVGPSKNFSCTRNNTELVGWLFVVSCCGPLAQVVRAADS